MRVPVIVALPAQEPLIASAEAFRTRSAPTIPMTEATVPAQLELDTSFAAIPIGTGRPEDAVLASLESAQSPMFAVRGTIEVEDPSEMPTEADGRPLFADPEIAPFVTCAGSAAVGSAADVQASLGVAQLAAMGLDGTEVAVVVMDTGINVQHLRARLGSMPRFDPLNSWKPPGTATAPFGHPVDHGTMCAYDVLLAAPNATLVDFPILAGSAPGSTVAGRTLSVALLAYAQVLASWAVGFGAGTLSRYRGLVVNNSWGMYHPTWDFKPGHPGRYSDNPRHPFNVIVASLAASGADVLFAAGNCGADCPDMRCKNRTTETIMGANAHPDVLTLAGCDTHDLRVGYSSQGPGIAGMSHDKPDLTTYTHFLGSEAFGAGSPDSGTSTACPVAAGCVAALRTRATPMTVPPANLFAQLRATARPAAGQVGWNGDYGHGILDAVTAAQSLGLQQPQPAPPQPPPQPPLPTP
jgi:hypothetical protein